MTYSFSATLATLAAIGLAGPALAQPAPPFEMSKDMAYAFDSSGKITGYKLGTSNAKELLKGAKRVPKDTIFFLGENNQIYMRTGPYLEGGGRFKFGPGQ